MASPLAPALGRASPSKRAGFPLALTWKRPALLIGAGSLKPGSHERHKHKHKINTKTKHDFSSGT